MLFLANPNNPTGTWIGESELDTLLRAVPANVIIVLDEAYHEYSAPLGVPDGTQWLARHSNLVVTRTFSKAYGLAGLRIGYSLSHPDIGDLLNRIRQPFNVSVPALAAATAALDDRDHLEATLALNRSGVDRLRSGSVDAGHRRSALRRQFRSCRSRTPGGAGRRGAVAPGRDSSSGRQLSPVESLANHDRHGRPDRALARVDVDGARCGNVTASPASFIANPGGRVAGEVRVPGDKSISHRAAMLGAIAEGVTESQRISRKRGLPRDTRGTRITRCAHREDGARRTPDSRRRTPRPAGAFEGARPRQLRHVDAPAVWNFGRPGL